MAYDELRISARDRAKLSFESTERALDLMRKEGIRVTFASVARAAGVSRTYLYNNPRFRQEILSSRMSGGIGLEKECESPKTQSQVTVLSRALKQEKKRRIDETNELRKELKSVQGQVVELLNRLSQYE